MSDGVGHIHEKIRSFQRKYYLNIFIRGVILTLAVLVGYFVLASLLEHALWLGQWSRLLIFITFFGVAGFCAFRFLNQPFRWWLAKRGLNDEEAARIIGAAMPSVKDRLVNLIQLESAGKDSGLAYASIRQKSEEFQPLAFDTVVDLRQNRKYLKYLAIPVGIVLIILLINQNILFQSTNRIVHFNREYSPEAPFTFAIGNKSLTAFYNEDFTIELELKGEAIPPSAYIVSKNQRFKMESLGGGKFQYTIERIQQPMDFQVEAAGFFSEAYEVELVSRPEVTQFTVELEYPRYILRKNEKIVNAGNLEVPEGTVVRWKLMTSNAEKANITFASDNQPNDFQGIDNQTFSYSKKFGEPDQYEIALENNRSRNKEKIAYRVDVVKDQYPQIVVNNFKDSVLYKRVILGGMIGDDYGVTQLSLNFRIRNEDQKEILKREVKIPISRNQLQQSFFYNWSIDSLKLSPGDQLEYYLQVWDNDGVNGRKSTRSASYTFLVPTEDNLIAEISRSQSQTQSQIDKSVDKATRLQDQIEQANQKLKGKQNLDWQDKKMLEDIIQQKTGLDQMVEQLKEQNKLLEDKKDAFTEQDERIKEKAEQIKKLMDELLDEETKKLFEELKKLLNENTDVSQIQKLLDKLNQNTNNLEKELERTLELFKQLQYDFKLDQTIQDLKKQIEEQKELLEKTESLEKEQKSGKDQKDDKKNSKGDKDKQGDESKGGDKDQKAGEENSDNKDQKDQKGGDEDSQNTDSQELAKDQEKLMEEFKETTEKIKELEKLGDELDKKDELPGEQDSKEVQDQQQQSKEMLQQKQPSKSKQPQKKAMEQMQQMQQQMEGMQSSMMMEMDMQNLESLRQILHGLVKLSFDQEGLMKEFNELQQNDPRFNTLAQLQLKLKDDAKVLEDSLLALGKKDPMMGSFITKEIGELNNHLDKVIESNRERRRPQASSEMQMTMTSINNLALMLDDHFDMMMQMMANAQPSMKKSNQKKGQKPSLSQMQQQLNQKIQELKNSGKSGRQLSEELAEMAAEQERIRRALQEMQEKMKNEGQMPGGDLPSKMEQTEMELVNKQITEQMIKRQKEIMTRLLETEKSMREQDMDDERKGETAKDYEKEIPKAFEEYLRLKEKEVELLKTVPPKLYPYYKKEVSEYFKRMGNNE
ncbi:DUF4175 family protein [Chryseosolibacter histidini]|nr:DUF4175 family protein [Chryseosolibacter histidini]